jgi:hypothetical protein
MDHNNERSSESLPLLQRQPSSFSSIHCLQRFGSQLDAHQVLSRPIGVIGEADAAAHRSIVKQANIRNVFFPFDTSYKIWWIITVMGAISTAFLLPYEIAFHQEATKGKDIGCIVEIILDSIFWIDLVVNFNLAIYKDSRLTYQRFEIVQAYLDRMFWIDLCGVFPFQSVALLASGKFGQNGTDDVLLYSLWRLPGLVRLHRLKKLSDVLQFDGHISFLWFTLIRNFAAVLLVAHW